MTTLPTGFFWGVLSGTIGSVIAVWVIFLLSRLTGPFWKKFKAPDRPLTTEEKVKLAQSLELYEKAMRRLELMSANPQELYIYLSQLSLTGVLLILFGLCLGLLAPYIPVTNAGILIAIFPVIGFVLTIAAMVEASKMSIKNIGRTRQKLQKNIDDAKTKLGMSLVKIISSSTETAHHAPSVDPQSPGSANTAL